MATARMVLDGMVGQLNPLFTGFSPAVYCGVGWPPRKTIESTLQGGNSLVAVYDGDGTRNTTRWLRTQANLVTPAPTAGISATLSQVLLAAGDQITFTITGTTNVNDAIVFSAQSNTFPFTAALGSATATGASDPLSNLATVLAADITARAGSIALGVTAGSLGAVVTVINGGTQDLTCAVNCGNQGSVLWENKRVQRFCRISTWTIDEPTRQAVSDPIDSLLGQLENYFGYILAEGDTVRVMYHGDAYVEDAQLADAYRRDFRISLEYGTTQLDTLYEVLGTSLSFTPPTY